jgi:hypothetical protein
LRGINEASEKIIQKKCIIICFIKICTYLCTRFERKAGSLKIGYSRMNSRVHPETEAEKRKKIKLLKKFGEERSVHYLCNPFEKKKGTSSLN